MGTALLLAMLLCQQQPCPTTASPPVPASSTLGWSVEYRWIDDSARADGTRRLWVGLRNESAEARGVCVSAVWYSIQNPAPLGSNRGGTAVGMGTHSCRDLWQFHLLMPSQVHYVQGQIEMPEYPGNYSLSFSVSATTLDYRGDDRQDVQAKSPITIVPIAPKE